MNNNKTRIHNSKVLQLKNAHISPSVILLNLPDDAV